MSVSANLHRRLLLLGLTLGPLLPASAASPAQEPVLRHFTSGGRKITVEWFGAGDGARPAVLLLHGAEGLAFSDAYRLASRGLVAAGYGVGFVHYLDRTGNRRVVYSQIRRDYPAWTATVRDALDWLAGQPDVDAGRLGIVGVSLGAALAMEAAASDTRIKAAVNYFGPLLEGFPQRAKRLPPTLILHGEKDQIVTVDHARQWEKLMKYLGAPYELKIYPDQGHGFFGAAQADSATRVAAFLDRHVAGRPGG